ncbi:MAG: methionine--tRNA ligase [Myxococcales bacterium]|nr:methionine--tRNA ligase [Myxococcales bacterium]
MPRTVYITTPIYYVNAAPHIGHAYTSIAADTLRRWHALRGADAFLLTGTDEHGLKIAQAARDAGVAPQAHADKWSKPFREMSDALAVSYDDFIRTTEPRHAEIVRAMWQRMRDAGDIYEGVYEGWYSVGDEAYFTEAELVDGRAPSGHAVEWVTEPSYFFRLSKYGPKLLEHFDRHPDFVRPESRMNEVRRFVEQGLQDISVSRTNFDWGVAVPDAPGHVAYVWLDALTNYISALGGPDGERFARYWSADDGFSVHLIGKDILRFHAVYWPAFLMSAGLPLPSRVFAHGWWTIEGQKMSKTLGNVVDPFVMAERYGVDAFRYFLLRETTFGTDGDFSEAALKNRVNGELANDYGNLVNRTLGMLQRYRGGVVPARGAADAEADATLLAAAGKARAGAEEAMADFAFHRALVAIWGLVGAANKYVDVTAPWKLDKGGDGARLDEVLYNLCEALRIIGILTLPFLPDKAAALLDRLGVPADERTFAATATWGGLPSGRAIGPGEALFPRIDDEKKAASAPPKKQKADKPMKTTPPAPASKKASAPPAEAPGLIDYADFAKLDLRVARVIAAEKHPNADRLLKLTLDAGDPEPRVVCAGIAAAYLPDELIGRPVALLANLAPRALRGVTSHGMLLAAGEGADVKLMTVPGDLPPGTRIS